MNRRMEKSKGKGKVSMELYRSHREKISNAFKTMKTLGIDAATVRPVLTRLLDLYNDEWELIEEDNYRNLADAIFEAAEDKADKGVDDERPLKKAHEGQSNVNGPSKLDGKKSDAKSEVNEQIRNITNKRLAESSESVPRNPVLELDHFGRHATKLKKEHKGHSNVNGPSKFDGKKTDGNSEMNEQIRNTKNKRPAESSQSVTRNPVIGLDRLGRHATKRNKGTIEMSRSSHEKKNADESGSACNQQTMIQKIQDIGSSKGGLVKVSLTCHRDIEKHNFNHPNVDEVLNCVELESGKLYRKHGGQFSLVKLLNAICESYLEMGDGSLNGSLTNGAPGSSSQLLLRSTQESRMVDNQVRNCSNGAVYKDDITNGLEKVKISLLQEHGSGDLPNFTYMQSSEIYQSAYVHISLARISDEDCCSGCEGNCISSSLPCACTRDTGGEFAYTPEGLLNPRFLESCISMKENPQSHHMSYCHDCPLERIKTDKNPRKCQGHLLRKFIKECWKKCGCSMECGNRVVQQGISRKLQVFHASNGKGWGVRTLEKLPAGAFICEYAGEILTNTELYERNEQRRKGRHVYPVLLDSDWTTESVLKDEEALCLDATDYGNVSRFMNHRCTDGNLIEIPVQVETLDRHYYHVAFFTIREVEALEELTWDYGIDFDDHNHPIEAFQCRCGSRYCRWKPRK